MKGRPWRCWHLHPVRIRPVPASRAHRPSPGLPPPKHTGQAQPTVATTQSRRQEPPPYPAPLLLAEVRHSGSAPRSLV